jgi:hypothetical protein
MCAAYLSDAAGLPPPRLVGRHHAGAPRPPAAVARQHRELGDGHGESATRAFSASTCTHHASQAGA